MIHWLAPLILVTVALALVRLALVEDGGETVSPMTAAKNAPAPLVTARPHESASPPRAPAAASRGDR